MNTQGCPLRLRPITPVAMITPGADLELMMVTDRVTGYNWLNFWDKCKLHLVQLINWPSSSTVGACNGCQLLPWSNVITDAKCSGPTELNGFGPYDECDTLDAM